MAIGIAGDASVSACGMWDVEQKTSTNITIGKKKKSSGIGENEVFVVNMVKKSKSGDGDKLFVSMVLIQVFAGNVALFGLIASIMLSQQVFYCGDE